jgi:cobalt-zinc-cadmium efflux system membrane fusion protein
MSGPVSRILVSPGARVERGEPLAIVASPDFAAAVASYRKAEGAWRNASRIATLDEQLFTNDALARSELDQARTDLAAATADRDAAVSQLRSLGLGEAAIDGIRDGKTVAAGGGAIRAPIAGTVVEKLVTPGQLLQAGTTPCFTIADLSTVWVMANVFESDLGAVRRGETALITTNAAPDTLPGRPRHQGHCRPRAGAEPGPAAAARHAGPGDDPRPHAEHRRAGAGGGGTAGRRESAVRLRRGARRIRPPAGRPGRPGR